MLLYRPTSLSKNNHGKIWGKCTWGSDSTSDTEEKAQDDGEESLEEVSSDEEEIRTYQFEPELDQNKPLEEAAVPDDIQLRLLNTDW